MDSIALTKKEFKIRCAACSTEEELYSFAVQFFKTSEKVIHKLHQAIVSKGLFTIENAENLIKMLKGWNYGTPG